MKFPLVNLLIALSLTACQTFEPGLKEGKGLHVIHDTIKTHLPGNLGQIIKHDQKYYCFVESDDPYSSKSFKDFYILSSTGEVEQKIEVPEEMNSFYYDLHLRNDSVLTKVYLDGGTFYLDPKMLRWVRTKDVDDVVFENEMFHVNYLDFGEWGGTLWFKDKRSGMEYELASSTPVVNVINDTFYVSTDRSVWRIPDPTKLLQCVPSHTYSQVVAHHHRMGSVSRQGAELLYMDSVYYYEELGVRISTSFTSQDTLYLLCVEGNRTFVGSIMNGQIEEHRSGSENMATFRRSFQYRSSGSSDRRQYVMFGLKGIPNEGVVEIDGGSIRVCHFQNSYSLCVLGTATADKSFKTLIDHQLVKQGNLTLQEFTPLAKAMGGTDVSPKHKISIGTDLYPNVNGYDLETPRVYKVVEDSTITLLMDLFHTKSDGSIKASMYSWIQTREPHHGIVPSSDPSLTKRRFEDRLNGLKEFLTERVGTPLYSSRKGKMSHFEWSTDSGVRVFLSDPVLENYQEIRLWVYHE